MTIHEFVNSRQLVPCYPFKSSEIPPKMFPKTHCDFYMSVDADVLVVINRKTGSVAASAAGLCFWTTINEELSRGQLKVLAKRMPGQRSE